MKLYQERYESAAGESLELEKLRRNLTQQLDAAIEESEKKTEALGEAEQRLSTAETAVRFLVGNIFFYASMCRELAVLLCNFALKQRKLKFDKRAAVVAHWKLCNWHFLL